MKERSQRRAHESGTGSFHSALDQRNRGTSISSAPPIHTPRSSTLTLWESPRPGPHCPTSPIADPSPTPLPIQRPPYLDSHCTPRPGPRTPMSLRRGQTRSRAPLLISTTLQVPLPGPTLPQVPRARPRTSPHTQPSSHKCL